ncbi:hypothetical protein M8J76_003803 [Diaphorina citri]|nr:hypothetical protein M8J76_003803 [Diaphorina citri]
MTIIEKARENHHINSTQELSGRVNTVRQQVKESQEKKRELEEKVAALKVQLYETQNNSGWEGLDQVYFQLKSIPKDELDMDLNEERHYMSTLQTLMRLYNKKKRRLQIIRDA